MAPHSRNTTTLMLFAAIFCSAAPEAAAKKKKNKLPKGEPTRMTVAPDGTPANHDSMHASTSSNARFTAFQSIAWNLVPGDAYHGSYSQIEVFDRKKGKTTRVSWGVNGKPANGYSTHPAISANGRFVAFLSNATNLVADPVPVVDFEVFLHDRKKAQTWRVSSGLDGQPSDAGAYIVSVSNDGRYVSFLSEATNLVPGDTNGKEDVFLVDRKAGTTTRVSVFPDGTEATEGSGSLLFEEAEVAPNGETVAFVSWAALVPEDDNVYRDVYLFDVASRTLRLAITTPDGVAPYRGVETARFSANSRRVVCRSSSTDVLPELGDPQARHFVLDLKKDVVSLGFDGLPQNGTGAPTVSNDGRFVAFYGGDAYGAGETNDEIDVYVHDSKTGVTTRVSESKADVGGDSSSFDAMISGNGKFVLFSSRATNLVETPNPGGHANVYLYRQG